MKKMMLVAAACVLLCFGKMALSNGNPASAITISPQTLLLGFEQSGSVTVHTNVPLGGQTSVMLENINARSVYADNQGCLVAKFAEDAVKAIVAPPQATLTLFIDGEDVGSDTVRVIGG